jgi:hypothetical protein
VSRYVFISYSRADRTYAARLRDEMTHRGVTSWYDGGIEHGAQWEASLRDAIDGSAAVLVDRRS